MTLPASPPEPDPSQPRGARHEVHRTRNRAHYDRATVNAILDAGLVAHVGFCTDGQPYVIPMLYARDGDALLLHGSVASRLCGDLAAGVAVCATVTHVDGLVLARSHFDHSVNYRSVVVFGRARLLGDAAEKTSALALFVETVLPGRAAEARPPDASELAATHVLRLEIEDASAKIRSGGPKEAASDLVLAYWAGVLPLETRHGAPLPAGNLAAGVEVPASVQALLARRGNER